MTFFCYTKDRTLKMNLFLCASLHVLDVIQIIMKKLREHYMNDLLNWLGRTNTVKNYLD